MLLFHPDLDKTFVKSSDLSSLCCYDIILESLCFFYYSWQDLSARWVLLILDLTAFAKALRYEGYWGLHNMNFKRHGTYRGVTGLFAHVIMSLAGYSHLGLLGRQFPKEGLLLSSLAQSFVNFISI